ncbi:MAG: hypothetical protein SGPRY_006441 [Prymnesium sp.]
MASISNTIVYFIGSACLGASECWPCRSMYSRHTWCMVAFNALRVDNDMPQRPKTQMIASVYASAERGLMKSLSLVRGTKVENACTAKAHNKCAFRSGFCRTSSVVRIGDSSAERAAYKACAGAQTLASLAKAPNPAQHDGEAVEAPGARMSVEHLQD